ncbi:MAG: 2-amino-4-hydroxy-6-hydroxymethyldihydropteridine diphosphokinase [Nitrospirae bacterium]|nr:2-amino-4-hydroxy-6-hydroxymethyldihydropteridine diphosphokinase [Nitrospirota bacterium]
MSTAYIGIGSNLGNREENCEKAVSLLRDNGVKVTKRSSMIETGPWGVTSQPKFINMAVEIETGLKPEKLLGLLKKIEAEIGRRPAERWGPREVDLDILLYDGLVIKAPEMEIPHPNMAEREFVLKPLSEIAPEIIHPALKKSISELLSQYHRSS